MEPRKIKKKIEKYFEGKTSLQEESELKNYFSSENVATELLAYKSLFVFFYQEKTTQSDQMFVLHRKSNFKKWISIAVSIVILMGIGFFMQQSEDLDTFDDPEIAFIETQKALTLIAENVNKGKEKIHLLQEYENAKNKIFINQKQ